VSPNPECHLINLTYPRETPILGTYREEGRPFEYRPGKASSHVWAAVYGNLNVSSIPTSNDEIPGCCIGESDRRANRANRGSVGTREEDGLTGAKIKKYYPFPVPNLRGEF